MQAIGEKGENLLVDQLRRPKDIYAGKRKRLGSGGNGIVPGSNETIDSHCSLLRFSETSVTPPGYRASLSFRGEVDIYYLCIITRQRRGCRCGARGKRRRRTIPCSFRAHERVTTIPEAEVDGCLTGNYYTRVTSEPQRRASRLAGISTVPGRIYFV